MSQPVPWEVFRSDQLSEEGACLLVLFHDAWNLISAYFQSSGKRGKQCSFNQFEPDWPRSGKPYISVEFGAWGKQKENARKTVNDMTWKAVAAEIRTRLVPSWHCQHSREKNPDSKQWLNAASVRWTQATVSHCFEAERLNKAWRQGQAFTTTVTAWRAARWVVSDGSICYSKQLNWWS